MITSGPADYPDNALNATLGNGAPINDAPAATTYCNGIRTGETLSWVSKDIQERGTCARFDEFSLL